MDRKAVPMVFWLFLSLVLLLQVFFPAPAAPANDLQLRLLLPQNNGQFFYVTFGIAKGVAADVQGNFYVVDTDNNRIQKFNAAGNFVTQWGSEGSENGQFYEPWSVAVDGSGNVYVADTSNHRIQKFDTAGVYQTQWGSKGTENGQFSSPQGVAVDGQNVYVADTYNHRIQKFDTAGVYQTQWGSKGTENGQFEWPQGVAADGQNVYVADTSNHRIQKFDTAGVYQTQWGSYGTENGQFELPQAWRWTAQGTSTWRTPLITASRSSTTAGVFLTTWNNLGPGSRLALDTSLIPSPWRWTAWGMSMWRIRITFSKL